MSTKISKIPREEAVEAIFSKIIQSPVACERLSETFYEHLNDDHLVVDSNSERFAKILFSAYETQDISALLLEVCRSDASKNKGPADGETGGGRILERYLSSSSLFSSCIKVLISLNWR